MIDTFMQMADRRAVIFNDMAYSYANLAGRIDYYSKLIREDGIEGGSVVAINSDYSFEAIALFFALADNKDIIVPIVATASEEIANRIQSAEADYVFTYDNEQFVSNKLHSKNEKHDYIEKLIKEKRSGLVLFSSGSTGKPKAMLHDLDTLMQGYRGRKLKEVNTLIFLTFDHIGGIDTLLRLLSIGGTITIPASRQPNEISRLIERHQINVLPSSPTFLNLLLLSDLHQKYDLSSLKIIAFGAEPMPESLLLRLRKLFPDIEFQQKFGTSETNAIKVTSRSSDSLFMKLDDPNLEHRVVDGELWLKSKTQVLGYLNAPMDDFTEDGWFKTGDLVETSEDGYIKIIGRNKEIINVGGEKVLPSEVESILLEMDEFNDVMVYGEENQITGESVAVEVVLRQDIDKREAKKAIRKFCRDKLDSYKIPTKIKIVDQTNFGDRFKKIRRR
jgi:acyl-CoA synthetase (AMP-forming)/AMP-acid ligase II